jgi:hypothetical protein
MTLPVNFGIKLDPFMTLPVNFGIKLVESASLQKHLLSAPMICDRITVDIDIALCGCSPGMVSSHATLLQLAPDVLETIEF